MSPCKYLYQMKNSKVYFFALIALIATACGNHKADKQETSNAR